MITWECNVGRAIRAPLHDIVLVFVKEFSVKIVVKLSDIPADR
jgi:hypothetical protein